MDTSHACALGAQFDELIFVIRNQNVILDSDLAKFYGIGVKVLNARISKRFSEGVCFILSESERLMLSNTCSRFRRLRYSHKPIHAYTETGAIIAALFYARNDHLDS